MIWKFVGTIVVPIALAVLWLWGGVRAPASFKAKPEGDYDFVVVGGGTAGCVLAATLSQDPSKRVLLLEAGDTEPWSSHIPLLAPVQMMSAVTWGYKTIEQKHSHWGYHDQVSMVPRGKFLGGTGQMNYLIHNISWAELDPNIAESLTLASNSKLLTAFLHAGEEGASGGHFAPMVSMAKDGERRGTLDIFLRPAMNRANLDIVLNTEVVKLEISDGGVRGLVLRQQSSDLLVRCLRNGGQVVLAAGSINTPLILFRSGIGPPGLLDRMRIPQVANLPVGQTLIDHIAYPLHIALPSDGDSDVATINMMRLLNPLEAAKYFLRSQGAWSSTGIEGQAFFEDDGFILLLYAVGAPNAVMFTGVSNMRMDTFEALFPGHSNPTQEGFILLCVCTDTKSRGFVSMNADTFEPIINPNFLDDSRDVSCLKKAVRKGVAVAHSPSMRALGAEVVMPEFVNCSHLPRDFNDDAYAECAIRTAAMTLYHPVATTPIGEVLQQDFRVKGIENLRVADGGVIGLLDKDFPNAKIISVAAQASQALLEGH